MKTIILNTVLLTATLFLSGKLSAQQSTIVIGGINIQGMSANEESVRLIIYHALVNSKTYVVLDRYDVAERLEKDRLSSCLGVTCLSKLGTDLNASYALGLSIDQTADRILIGLKLVDVQKQSIIRNDVVQFEQQSTELNRMLQWMVQRMNGTEVSNIEMDALLYKDIPSRSTTLGKLNNSGPRIGFGFASGANAAYFQRKEKNGGLGSEPIVFNLGYQLEQQYVGNEKFSALFEFIGNLGGIEHGICIPSLAILHGVRFGKGAWEFAFGPSLSAKKLIDVTDIGDQSFTKREINQKGLNPNEMEFYKRPDTRGVSYFSTNFIFGIGKTIRSGALNIPLNVYLSTNKYGHSVGMSIGMNISRANRMK